MARRSNSIDVPRLCKSISRDRLSLRYPREQRTEAFRQVAGSHFSEEGSRKEVPINLLSLYISIVSKNLIPKNPRVMLSTFDPGIKPMVFAMQQWMNQEIEHMGLANSMERVILDALWGTGICKVALATPAEAGFYSWQLEAGSVFARPIDLDDFVFDVHARDFSECGYIGHRYRVPLAMIKDDRSYSKQRKTLTASSDPGYNQEGDERISMIGRTWYSQNDEEFEDHVDLWEIWLPRHNVLLTLADDQCGGPGASGADYEPLKAQNWIGPPTGPYKFLGYQKIPSQPMFKGPMQDLIDQHILVNRLERKLADQASNQKELLGFSGGSEEDAGKVTNASDGEAIRLDAPDRAKVFNYRGPDPKNFQFLESRRNLFKELAGNLDMLGGLNPQSKTLGQDRLLAEGSSRSIVDMQARTVDFMSDVISAMCWYWYNDPFKVMRTKIAIPGVPDISILKSITPEQRTNGRFEDLNIQVDPYSMQHQTPATRLQTLRGIWKEDVLPALPILQQMGIAADFAGYFKKIGMYTDDPDFAELLTITEPLPQAGGAPASPGSPGGDRTVTRNNVSTATQGSQSDSAVEGMMAAAGDTEGGLAG